MSYWDSQRGTGSCGHRIGWISSFQQSPLGMHCDISLLGCRSDCWNTPSHIPIDSFRALCYCHRVRILSRWLTYSTDSWTGLRTLCCTIRCCWRWISAQTLWSLCKDCCCRNNEPTRYTFARDSTSKLTPADATPTWGRCLTRWTGDQLCICRCSWTGSYPYKDPF